MKNSSRCDICYQPIGDDQKPAYCNNCGQDYHSECISQSINQNDNCPICKSAFSENYKSSKASQERGGKVLVQVNGLHKHFDEVLAVNGVDFEVHENEVVVIVGASGSGKSTVLRCINRLEDPTEGHIIFDGEDITSPDIDINQVRSEIGFVFQSFELFPHLTVLRNVTTALELVRHMSPKDAITKAKEVLDDLDLSDKYDAYPGQLSGGQKQRVAIARALAMNPKLILFDEPTSALDPELIGYVLDTLRLLADKGVTMVVVTHQINFAKEVADWAIYMTEGRIVEQGVANEMLNDPKEERTKQFLARTN